jgi:hypothetical protein
MRFVWVSRCGATHSLQEKETDRQTDIHKLQERERERERERKRKDRER